MAIIIKNHHIIKKNLSRKKPKHYTVLNFINNIKITWDTKFKSINYNLFIMKLSIPKNPNLFITKLSFYSNLI